MKKEMTASEMGKKGGTNRAKNMTPEERKAHAKKMIMARWAKFKAQKEVILDDTQ